MITLAAALLLIGCGSTPKPTTDAKPADAKPADAKPADKPAGEGSKSRFGNFDAAAELEHLQGKWRVREQRESIYLSTWTITGDKILSVNDAETREGKLKLPYPGMLEFERADRRGGTDSTLYGYARDGDKTWIGTGAAGFKSGSDIYLGLSYGLVHFDGKTCRYQKVGLLGRWEGKTTVKCALDGDKFRYSDVPNAAGKRIDKGEVAVIGSAVLSNKLDLVTKAP